MTFFIDDFIEVTEKNNIHFYTISQEESKHIFRRLFDKFFSNKLSMEKPLEIPLWQLLNKENSIGVHLPNAAESFLKMPANERMVNVKVNGYVFSVTRDGKTGKISNAFPTIPNSDARKPTIPPQHKAK